MKKIVLLLIGLLFLSGPVLAYQINIQAPESLAVGKPLIITGTTTFGIGTPIDVVLYYQVTTTTEIKRNIVYIQPDKTFKTVFDTTSLKPGTYKVEVPATANSDSVTMRVVALFDRSEDIHLSSPLSQEFTGKIFLNGEIKGLENSGVQVEVIDPDGLVVFGPQYINTDNAAHFSAVIAIPSPGEYEVSFTDANGYIGSRTVSSGSQALGTGQISPEVSQKIQPSVISAHSRSSRDIPAYFTVDTGTGLVTLSTSKSLDWVIEYVDENGVLHMENNKGEMAPERAEFRSTGKTVYVKIYPYKYSVTGDVFLYGENVDAIVMSPVVPAPFTAGGQPVSPTQESPGDPFIGIMAVCMAVGLMWKNGS